MKQPPDGAAESRRAKRGSVLVSVVAGLVLLALSFSAVCYLNSALFREHMRQKLIFALQSVTGGTVEIGSFDWHLSRLEFTVDDITIHGLEAPGEQPYAHADHLRARLRILSIVRREIALQELALRRPIVHIVVYPDGHTNQPSLPIGGKNAVQALFNLSMERLQLEGGWLLWNERRIPLDFSADDFSLRMAYVGNANRYDAQVRAGKLNVLASDYQLPLAQAQAEFSLYTDHLTLNSMAVSAGNSRLEVSGSLTNWNDPVLTAQYKVVGDSSETSRGPRRGSARWGDWAAMLTPIGARAAASLSPLRQFSSGEFEITGKGDFSRQTFTTSGKATFKDVTWAAGPLAIRNLTGGLEFSATPESIAVPHLFASVLGGSVTGQAEIENWLKAASAVDHTAPAQVRRSLVSRGTAAAEQGTVNLVLRALSLKELSASLPKRAHESLKLDGRLRGKVAIAWRGSPENAEARFNLNVAEPPLVPPGDVPLSAHLEGTYSGSRRLFEIATLNAQSKASRLQASGSLGAAASNLRVAVDTSNLGEIQPLLAQIPLLPRTLPLEAGAASISGTFAGAYSAPVIAARLELHDVTTAIERKRKQQPPPAQPALLKQVSRMVRALSDLRQSAVATAATDELAPLRLHWDEAQAEVFYSPQTLMLRQTKLRRGQAEVDWEGGASLLQGKLVESSQIRGHLQLRGVELADLQSIFETSYPIQGRLETSVQIDGSRTQLNGNGHLALANAAAYDHPLRSASADLKFEGSNFKLQNLVASNDWGEVTGGGEYDFSGRRFSFLLHGANFQLARLSQLQARWFHVQGALGFEAQGSGTAEAPVINAALRLHDLMVNGERIGDFNVLGVTNGADLKLIARSELPNAQLALDGNIHLRGEMPMQAKLVAANVALDPLLKNFFPAGHAAHAVLDGEIEIQGDARSPLSLRAEVDIPRLAGELEGLPIRNVGPIRLHLHDRVVTVEQLRLEGLQTHFVEIHGQVNLSGNERCNLDADGRVDLKLVQTLAPELSSRGLADLSLQIRGTVPHPALNGQVRITDGAVSYVDLPNGLSNINGVLAFNRNGLQVRELTAITGGGRLKLGGSVSYAQELVFHLTAEGRDIRLRYPEGVSSSVNASFSFSGTTSNAILSGDVTVSRLALNPRFDFASYLVKTQLVSAPLDPKAPANNIKLDVHVVSTPQLQVQTSLARVSGNLDLHVRGSAARPSLLGRISILEGNISLAGTTYRLNRGDISFTNPVSIDANVDIEASARVRDYDITLGLQGTLSRMKMTYRSDPPLSSSDIISLLALGRAREDEIAQLPGSSLSGTPNLSESNSSAILGEALNSAVNSRLQKLFGVSRIKIDPNVAGQQSGANARLTIEQTVSDRVTLTYITNVAQSAQQILQFEYYITPRISIVGVRDQNGVVSFNVFVRRRKS